MTQQHCWHLRVNNLTANKLIRILKFQIPNFLDSKFFRYWTFKIQILTFQIQNFTDTELFRYQSFQVRTLQILNFSDTKLFRYLTFQISNFSDTKNFGYTFLLHYYQSWTKEPVRRVWYSSLEGGEGSGVDLFGPQFCHRARDDELAVFSVWFRIR